MRNIGSLVILGVLLLAGQSTVRASAPGSDWPSLNYDAAQSNNNTAEKVITAKNVLKFKAKWTVPIPDASYPIVAGGRVYVPIVSHGKVHVRALDALTGKPLATYPKDAQGGILYRNGTLYLAGHTLQVVVSSTGSKTAQISPTAVGSAGTFLDPVGDSKLVLAGFASTKVGVPSSLYAIDPTSNQVLWSVPSNRATGAIGTGRILTEITTGSAFYDEVSGKRLASRRWVSSDWFAGDTLVYTVATMKRGKATLYAMDGAGNKQWSQVVGPYMIAQEWPHAVSSNALYVQTLQPRLGIQALDPLSGQALWHAAVPDVERLALANGLLFAVSYRLGQPVRLVVILASTGRIVGSLVLSAGFSAWSAKNELMIADGMIFLRVAVGLTGSQLVAFGLP